MITLKTYPSTSRGENSITTLPVTFIRITPFDKWCQEYLFLLSREGSVSL
jgi:hypothetical protein